LFRKHQAAFGLDGHLGEVDAQAKIQTKEGVEPISLPMHGASPEKRRVIEEQLEKWFSQGVIEPSASPWGAPIVIVYRNGNRICQHSHIPYNGPAFCIYFLGSQVPGPKS
ncbi:hypothetical protein AURDEDRAFT_77539, partial [Auricularia subglabra TFB-10046 SS5]